MIVSAIDGRIRIRTSRLQSSTISQRVKARIQQLPGVSDVRTNPEASSLVVHFDPGKIELLALEDAIIEICAPRGKSTKQNGGKWSKRLNQANKIGMMGALATSLAYGLAGQKKNHIRYGTAFVALAGMHMLKNAGRLLK